MPRLRRMWLKLSPPGEFASLPPVVEIIPGNFTPDTDYYEFRADIPPIAIPAGTKVWFSVFADTANDPDDTFLWRSDDLGNSASRSKSTGVISEAMNERPPSIDPLRGST